MGGIGNTSPLFEKDPSNPTSYYAVVGAVIWLILSWLVVGARFVARRMIRGTGMDDWFILINQAVFTLYAAALFMMKVYVPGRTPLNFYRLDKATKWLVTFEVTYAACMVFMKISLGYFFLRIVHERRQRLFIIVIVSITVLYNIYMVFWGISVCGDPKDYTLMMLTHGCVRWQVYLGTTYAQGVINTFSDIVLAVIPFLILRKSMLPPKVKTYVYSILFLSTAGCIVGFVRFFYLHNVFGVDGANIYRAVSALAMVSMVEIGAGIVASSLATLRPLLSPLLGLSQVANARKDVNRSPSDPPSKKKPHKFLSTISTYRSSKHGPNAGSAGSSQLSEKTISVGMEAEHQHVEDPEKGMTCFPYPSMGMSGDFSASRNGGRDSWLDKEMEVFELTMRDRKGDREDSDDSPLFVPRAVSQQSRRSGTEPGSPSSSSLMSGTTVQQPMSPLSPEGGNLPTMPAKAAGLR